MCLRGRGCVFADIGYFFKKKEKDDENFDFNDSRRLYGVCARSARDSRVLLESRGGGGGQRVNARSMAFVRVCGCVLAGVFALSLASEKAFAQETCAQSDAYTRASGVWTFDDFASNPVDLSAPVSDISIPGILAALYVTNFDLLDDDVELNPNASFRSQRAVAVFRQRRQPAGSAGGRCDGNRTLRWRAQISPFCCFTTTAMFCISPRWSRSQRAFAKTLWRGRTTSF